MATVAVLTIHGMGMTKRGYSNVFVSAIKDILGPENWQNVAFEEIFYQGELQAAQEALWDRSNTEYQLRWDKLRKFMLYAFSDATSLESLKERPGSAYELAQKDILNALTRIYDTHDTVPVVLLGYSLGCQVLSNYIWDAQKHLAGEYVPYGVWKAGGEAATIPDDAKKRFLALTTLQVLYTVGCNIPIFVAGQRITKPFQKPNENFKWVNLFDRDDVLGWPLGPLDPEYAALVEDRPISVTGHDLSGILLASWTPFSHGYYLEERNVYEPFAEEIRELLNAP